MERNRALFEVSCLVVVLMLTGGCATYDIAKPVKSFSDATSMATETTRKAFETTDQTFIRRTVEETIASYPSNHSVLTNLTFKNLKPYLPPEDLQARLDVLAGLQTYSEKLAALAGNEQLDEFDRQAKQLGEKLQTFDNDLVKTRLLAKSPATDAEIALLGTAIREIGSWVIKAQRQKTIKSAVTNMNPHVIKIAAFLKADLTDLARQAENDYHQISDSLSLPIRENIMTDPAARDSRFRQIATAILEGKKAIATANSLTRAADQLAKAHGLLAEAVTKPNTKFIDLVISIYGECKNAKDFYDSLAKKN